MTLCAETEMISNALKQLHLCNPEKIADTLQGNIWRASTASSASKVVMKVTNQKQHNNAISIVNHQIYHNVQENILLEQRILKYLTQQTDFPPSIVKFVSFFKTKNEYCLVMEDGGTSLLHFAASAHKLIKKGHIDISHWKKIVKIVFKQMMECIEFIHYHNVCHNDISLENFVINDVKIVVNVNSNTMKFVTDDIQIKLCDFGLAELHTNKLCISNKYCGKTQYKSPEMMKKERYVDGKKNDIWCCGICLFMLGFGCAPFAAARAADEVFIKIMSGHIVDVLVAWDLLLYIDAYIIDFLRSIFQYEEHRISVAQMKQHLYLR